MAQWSQVRLDRPRRRQEHRLVDKFEVLLEVGTNLCRVTTTVRVRYFAGARGAVGLTEESVSMPAEATVRDLVAELGGKHGEKLTRVLTACSFLLDGVAVRDLSIALPNGSDFDVLPPFAGG
jgi:molybdopterin synthase sulfur carrier subunit